MYTFPTIQKQVKDWGLSDILPQIYDSAEDIYALTKL